MLTTKFPWLKSAIDQYPPTQFPSSLIIEGANGLAKRHLAFYYAKQLLCFSSPNTCKGCNSCTYLEAGSHPDYCFLSAESCSSALHALSKEKKESLVSKKIDGILALNDFMSRTNAVSLNRVGVIFDSHTMNLNSQNALLKTLEDLPENKFIIIVSNKRKCFLPTIYSRSSILSINNPSATELNTWINDQGYIGHSILNFAPESSPLEIESMINNNNVGQYQEITSLLDSYFAGRIDLSVVIKTLKELNLSYEDKINSLVEFLKTCLGIATNYYKHHPLIGVFNDKALNHIAVSDLIGEIIDYKASFIKVPSLNEQIGLSYFFLKAKKTFITK